MRMYYSVQFVSSANEIESYILPLVYKIHLLNKERLIKTDIFFLFNIILCLCLFWIRAYNEPELSSASWILRLINKTNDVHNFKRVPRPPPPQLARKRLTRIKQHDCNSDGCVPASVCARKWPYTTLREKRSHVFEKQSIHNR